MSESLPVPFGSLLRSLRTAAGLTQEELAEAARVSYRSISDLERGVSRSPRRDTARLLADALGLSAGARARFEAAAHGRPPANQDVVPWPLPGEVAAAVRTLPRDVASFTGRESEIESILTTVTSAGEGGVVDICAIDGMPGAGKTALVVHAAHALRDRFPDRQLFIDLHAHTPGREPVLPDAALAGLLACVGVDPRFLPPDLDGRAAIWRDRMAGQRALLVLDNAAGTSQVAPLLPGDGGCLVLVTSRRHLGDLPGAVTPVLLDVLPPSQAAQMFTRLAPRAVRSHAEVGEVVELAGFLPLAISLLARLFARHQSWTLANLAAETRASLLTLTAERQGIAAAFGVSFHNLDPAQRKMFCLLGLHPGTSFDGYAAAALAGTSLQEAAGLLDALHGEGLLTETGHRRYGMHDLLRRYARDHAAGLSGSEQAVEQLMDYYQYTAAIAQARMARYTRPGPPLAAPAPGQLAVPDLQDDGQALAWTRADRASLFACLDHAIRTGQHARVIALAALTELLRRDGPWTDAVTRHTAAAQAARRLGDRLAQANALTDLGNIRRLTGDHPAAVWVLEQALDIYRDLGERLGQANALTELGAARHLGGDYPDAIRVLQQALDIYRDLSEQHGRAHALVFLGVVRRARGDYLDAIGVLEQAVDIYRDLGDRLGQANALRQLGAARQLTGDYPDAIRVLKQALGIYHDLGSRLGQAHALIYLGVVRRLTGDYPDAARVLEQAKGICRDLGDRSGEAEALNERGSLHRVAADLASAEGCHWQALELARTITSFRDEAHALAGLGRCAIAAGRATEARTLLQQALEICQRIGLAEAPALLAELDAL